METSRLLILPDPELSQPGAQLEQKISDAGELLSPEELPALLDSTMRRCLENSFDKVQAHEGTVWLFGRDRDNLIAAFNNKSPDFIGFAQPLDSGLISMVAATEQPSCENSVFEHREHAGDADQKVGKLTCSMIAVPLYFGSRLRGVISCVQHKDHAEAEDPPGFSTEHLEEIEFVAELLGQLIEWKLAHIILGIEA